MSIFGGLPDSGDWVRATRTVPVTFTDTLLSSGLPRGSRGVVLSRTGSRVTVEFDAGWGTQRATLPVAHCQIVRRGGGVQSFQQRNRRLTAVRLGLALVFVFPILQFVVQYVITTHGVHGLLGALAIGGVQSVIDMLTGFLTHPVKSIVYFAILGLMSRVAFGPRR